MSDESSALRTAKDLFAGAVGGAAQVLLGQPFDIVKVRLQTASAAANTSAVQAATAIWKQEGPLAFYKGTLTPLLGIGACVSVQFGAFHQARRWFEAKRPLSSSSVVSGSAAPAPPLSYSQYYASGAFAGVANTVLSSPIEHVRIRLQTQPHGAGQRLYAGPLDCIRQLSRADAGGVGRGLYRGTSATLLREAQAYGLWFLTFEYLMNGDAQRNHGGDRSAIPSYRIAWYGGLAGEALWLGSYPFDVVKSKMQTDGLSGKDSTAATTTKTTTTTTTTTRPVTQRYASMTDCFRQTWRAEGWRGFWRGLGPTLLRAMPVSAGTFAVVELTMRAMS